MWTVPCAKLPTYTRPAIGIQSIVSRSGGIKRTWEASGSTIAVLRILFTGTVRPDNGQGVPEPRKERYLNLRESVSGENAMESNWVFN